MRKSKLVTAGAILGASLFLGGTASAGTTGAGSASGEIDSGGAVETFTRTRTATAGGAAGTGRVRIKQTRSTAYSATNIAMRNCGDTATVADYQSLTDGAQKDWNPGNGICYRLRMYRINAQDTNSSWVPGWGTTIVDLALS
jgi:hypothetical protein